MATVITLFFFSIHVLAVLCEQGCTMTCCEGCFLLAERRFGQAPLAVVECRNLDVGEAVLKAKHPLPHPDSCIPQPPEVPVQTIAASEEDIVRAIR